jgi:outer membrane protein
MAESPRRVLLWSVVWAIFQATDLAAWADTLEQALAKAYQNNPQLNSQRAVVRATDEDVPQALSGYRPSVTATASSGHELTSNLAKGVPPSGAPTYTRTASGYAPTTLSATASQTLYNGYQTANRTRLAETNTSAAREALRVAEQTVLLNAATAYMDLLRDNALLEVQRNNLLVLQELLRQTSARYMTGELSRTDVALAEANLAQTRGTVLIAEAQVAKSRAIYRQVIGVEATNLTPGAPVDRLSPRNLAEAIELGRVRHPNVGVAMFGIDAAVLQVKINEGSLYPNVTLTGTISQSWSPPNYQAVSTVLLQQFNAFVVGQVRVPLYQGGTEYALIRQSKETVGQKRIDLDGARDAVQANVATSWTQLEAARAQILAAQTQVAASEIAYDGVRDEARNGLRTTFDVLYAIITLITARSTLLTAQHDRVVASYALLAAVGELNLAKLGIEVPLYDPMVHYQQIRDAWIGVRTPDGR